MAELQMISTRLDGGSSHDTESVATEETTALPLESEASQNEPVASALASEEVPLVSHDTVVSVKGGNIEHTEELLHEGPHIMTLKAEYVPGLPITTTSFTTTLFLFMVVALALYGKRVVDTIGGRLRTAIVSFVDVSYQFLIDSFDGDRGYARKYYPLIMGVFVVIFFGNLFGLLIDWFGFSFPGVHSFVRPIFSDLASTLPFAIITVIYSLIISSKIHGLGHTAKGYLFNWTGNGIGEKCVNVFVGWLHFVGVPSSIASLSLRLFGNIFAGVILISVLGYLGRMATESFLGVGVLMTLPFWFFELFVAFVQAAVFSMLMVAIFKQAHSAH